MAAVDEQYKAELEKVKADAEAEAEPLETVSVRPTKQNISVKLVALAWAPTWQAADGNHTPAWK